MALVAVPETAAKPPVPLRAAEEPCLAPSRFSPQGGQAGLGGRPRRCAVTVEIRGVDQLERLARISARPPIAIFERELSQALSKDHAADHPGHPP